MTFKNMCNAAMNARCTGLTLANKALLVPLTTAALLALIGCTVPIVLRLRGFFRC